MRSETIYFIIPVAILLLVVVLAGVWIFRWRRQEIVSRELSSRALREKQDPRISDPKGIVVSRHGSSDYTVSGERVESSLAHSRYSSAVGLARTPEVGTYRESTDDSAVPDRHPNEYIDNAEAFAPVSPAPSRYFDRPPVEDVTEPPIPEPLGTFETAALTDRESPESVGRMAAIESVELPPSSYTISEKVVGEAELPSYRREASLDVGSTITREHHASDLDKLRQNSRTGSTPEAAQESVNPNVDLNANGFGGQVATIDSNLSALAALPEDQIRTQTAVVEIERYISQALSSGIDQVSVGEILNITQSEHGSFNRAAACDLASLLEKMGYASIPDPRVHGIKPRASDVLKVFGIAAHEQTQLSDEFYLSVVLIHLSVMVSRADSQVLDSETKLTNSLVSGETNLTEYENASLSALSEWCFSNSIGYKGVKRNIEKLRLTDRLKVWDHLVSLAVVDGDLDPREIAELDQIYNLLALDLSKKQARLTAVSNALLAAKRQNITSHVPVVSDSLGTEALVQNSNEGGAGVTSDGINTASPDGNEGDVAAFVTDIEDVSDVVVAHGLDQDKLKKTRDDNEQVKKIFAGIFQDDPLEDDDDDESDVTDEPTILSPSDDEDQPVKLDKSHRKLLKKLAAKDEWERSEYNSLCGDLNLFPDGAMEIINDWSLHEVQEPLLEDDVNIYVDRSLDLEVFR